MPSLKKLMLSIISDRPLLNKLSPTRDGPWPLSANSRVSLLVIPHHHPQTLYAAYLPTCATLSQVATMPTQMHKAITVLEMVPEMTPEMISGMMMMMMTMRTGLTPKVT